MTSLVPTADAVDLLDEPHSSSDSSEVIVHTGQNISETISGASCVKSYAPDIVSDIFCPSCTSTSEESAYKGRTSNGDMKKAMFLQPIMHALSELQECCPASCPLKKNCTQNATASEIYRMRIEFQGEDTEEAPTDKMRAQAILGYIRQAVKDRTSGEMIFTISSSRREVCVTGFCRLIGVLHKPEIGKIPNQWKRLLKGVSEGHGDAELLENHSIVLDAGDAHTLKQGHAIAFINELANYYADSIPTVNSEESSTSIKVVPYKFVSDVYNEYNFLCTEVGTPAQFIASQGTFLVAWNKLHDSNSVRLMGGKGSFQTCSICNQCMQIKKSSRRKKDVVSLDIVKEIHRHHLKQQQTQRQYADNIVALCKSQFVDEYHPKMGFIELDGQTVETGNSPYAEKEGMTGHPVIENRNIGARLVCGPIDRWISISTNNLVPGGANILIEASKLAVETLAEFLADLNMAMPRDLKVQYDNSTENKVKYCTSTLNHLFTLHFPLRLLIVCICKISAEYIQPRLLGEMCGGVYIGLCRTNFSNSWSHSQLA